MLISFFIYFAGLIVIGIVAYRRQAQSSELITSSRSLNYWVTAISAQASDMSSWLFMGFPAAVYTIGLRQVWVGVGLVIFMFLNWHFIAPKLRVQTEVYNCFTLSGYFGNRFKVSHGSLRFISSIIALLFFSVYVSAGFVGIGMLFENVFNIQYQTGLYLSICVVVIYILIGGYVAVAWADFFQGIFLIIVIIIVPSFTLVKIGGFNPIGIAMAERGLSLSLPEIKLKAILEIFFYVLSLGLGYFGQSHILSKFMGIKNTNEIYKAKYIGITWQIISLLSATFVGIVAMAFFKNDIVDPQLIFVIMTKESFFPLVAGFSLCAILAATISTVDSQILVLANVLTEDFYQNIFHKHATSQELRIVSRASIVIIAIFSFCIAYGKLSTIYNLVTYAWTGLGVSFGPLLVLSLYCKSINKYGAIAGLVVGGLIAALWPWLSIYFKIPGMIPGFVLSGFSIIIVSFLTSKKSRLMNVHKRNY